MITSQHKPDCPYCTPERANFIAALFEFNREKAIEHRAGWYLSYTPEGWPYGSICAIRLRLLTIEACEQYTQTVDYDAPPAADEELSLRDCALAFLLCLGVGIPACLYGGWCLLRDKRSQIARAALKMIGSLVVIAGAWLAFCFVVIQFGGAQ